MSSAWGPAMKRTETEEEGMRDAIAARLVLERHEALRTPEKCQKAPKRKQGTALSPLSAGRSASTDPFFRRKNACDEEMTTKVARITSLVAMIEYESRSIVR